MDFNVSSAALLKGISDVSKAIPAKTTLSILENFLFVLKGDQLEITASDQELTLRTVITVDNASEDGSIAVPARQMLDLFKALPDQPVNIRTTSESAFECKWGNGNSEFPFFPAEDFPEISGADPEATCISMPAGTLIAGIGSTIYATSDDPMRPAMNGIFFDIAPESTTMVASDAHKLVCYTTSDVKAEQPSSFILAKKPASVLKSIVSEEDGEVKISFDNATVQINFAQTMMVCRMVAGKFPRYRDVIPQNNSNILRIDRVQLLNTVRRVAVCANKASNHIKFELKPGQIEITAQDLGFAIAAYEKIECDYNGADLAIGFKSSFIIDMLGNMSCETVMIKFGDMRRAALIVPSEEESDTEKVCGILMPVMVS